MPSPGKGSASSIASTSLYRSVWLSKNQGGRKDTLYIFSVANGPRDIQPLNGVSILLIRITSPWYHTANSISTGNTLPQILRSFPGARTIDQSQTLYDDAEQGIAFEFAGRATAGSPCTAIMVHPPGKVNLATAKDVNEILRQFVAASDQQFLFSANLPQFDQAASACG